MLLLLVAFFLCANLCSSRVYKGHHTDCGSLEITYCFDQEWKQNSPLAWNHGDKTLPDLCKAYDTKTDDSGETVTCLTQPVDFSGSHPCGAIITEANEEISIKNFIKVAQGNAPVSGNMPEREIVCKYKKDYADLKAQINTYEAKDVQLSGTGKFDVRFLPCKNSGSGVRCSDSDMYKIGEGTMPIEGMMYFRACVRGVSGAKIYPVFKKCTTHDGLTPETSDGSMVFAEDYCGAYDVIDAATNNVMKTKISTSSTSATEQCTFLEMGSHKFGASSELHVTCVIDVCLTPKCANLVPISEDKDATCRQDWSPSRRILRSDRLLQSMEKGKDYEEVSILSMATVSDSATKIESEGELQTSSKQESSSSVTTTTKEETKKDDSRAFKPATILFLSLAAALSRPLL